MMSVALSVSATPGAVHGVILSMGEQWLASTMRIVQAFAGKQKKAVACGGCYYPVDSVPMTPQDWQQHFSEQWCTFAAAKQAFDPNHLLNPQQGVFDLRSVSE